MRHELRVTPRSLHQPCLRFLLRRSVYSTSGAILALVLGWSVVRTWTTSPRPQREAPERTSLERPSGVATVRGTVREISGQGLAHSAVFLFSPETGRRMTVTGPEGSYEFREVAEG